MYLIYYNNELVYDPRAANCAEPGDPTYALEEGSLELAVDAAGQLTMTLAEGNPMIGTLRVRLGTVKVVELLGTTSTTVFLGRVIRDTLNIDNSHSYECEGRLACLNDTVMTPYIFPDNYESDAAYRTALANNTVPAYWLRKLLEIHNGMAWNSDNQIQPGTVTVTGGVMYRAGESWETMWNVLRDDLPGSSLGGHLVMRYEGDAAYLDYLADFTAENAQAVTFGQNLIDLARTHYAADYYNAIIPIGKDGLTCAAAPNGYYGSGRYYKSGTYLVTPTERDAGFGNVVRVVTWDEVETAAELVTKAVDYLNAAKFVDEIEISAADLSGVDGTTQPFRLARRLTIDDPPQSIRTAYAIVGLGIDILGDVETKLTLGSRGVTMTSSGRGGGGGGGSVVAGGVSGVKGSAESTYRTGNVNLSPANIGAVAKTGDAMTGQLGIGTATYGYRVKLRSTDDGRGNIQIYRADGSQALNIYAQPHGGEVDIMDSTGATRAALYINETNGGVLYLRDMDGNSSTLNRSQLSRLLALI